MKWIDNIPKIWKRAYLLICIWYFVNFAVSAFFEWKFSNPSSYVLWNTFFLFEALCVLIVIIFLWTHWLFRFRAPIQIIGHVIGLIIHFLLMGTLSYYFNDYMEGLVYFEHWQEHIMELMSWDATRIYDQYIITVAVYYIISYFQGLQKQQSEKSELALKNKEMQISLLKSQINPHFLFNTLNSISTLVSTSKEQARRLITQLSDIFRYALDSHSGEKVKLIHEIDFIENYIRIQQVRFGDRLRFEKNIDTSCLGISIPPMILQPLVENSIKHGVYNSLDEVKITLHTKKIDNLLFIIIGNDYDKNETNKKGTGTGLTNIRKRLKLLYNNDNLMLINDYDNYFEVTIKIPQQ